MTLRGIVRIVLCLASTQACAQAPTNVNDCTLLPDPVALKRCVDGFGPQSLRSATPLPLPSAPPEAAQAAQPGPTSRAAAVPPANTRSDDWLHGGKPADGPERSDPNAIQLDE